MTAIPATLAKHKLAFSLFGIILGLAFANSAFNFWSTGPKAVSPNISGSGNLVVINARTLDDVRPEDVPCKGDVYVAETGRGLFYRAIYGDIVLSWTAGDARYAMTDGLNTAYPSRDPVIDRCLERRAKKAPN